MIWSFVSMKEINISWITCLECSFYTSPIFNFQYSKDIYHNHQLVVPSAQMSLTLSRHPSQSFIASAGPQAYTAYPHRAAVRRFKLIVLLLLSHMKGSIGVHHLSLLLHQCPACRVRLTLIVFVMAGRWPYSCCFVGCCLQYWFNIVRIILV